MRFCGLRVALLATLALTLTAVPCSDSESGQCAEDESADTSTLLQSRVNVREKGKQAEEGGKCDATSDTNCCFTDAGVAFALKVKAVPEGTTAGMCAAGAKDVAENAGKSWAGYISEGYVAACADDACTNWNGEALKPGVGGKAPASGKCSDFKCKGPMFKQKTTVSKDALCTTYEECEYNCCDVDINARANERSEILSFATIMVLKNATAISADLDVEEDKLKEVKESHDFKKDVNLLKDSWAGVCKVMKQVEGGEAACPQTDITKMKSCIHKVTCVIEEGVDYKALEKDQDQLKTYTLLVELYDKFETVAWDKMMAILKEEKVQVQGADFVSPAELACAGLKKLRKHAFFMEADNEEQEAAYRVSAALVDSAKTTHAVLDSHTANSSVEETVAALHRAWQVPCEMLDCDHTNYWDLLGASHRHSLALIESGASAHHMRVHVGVRARLEHRMQVFIGTDGMLFANRYIRTEGTRTEALARAYADALYEAARKMWTEHPKKYGVSTLLLSLVPREKLHEQAKTDFQKLAVQAIMDDNLVMASKKATLYRMMEERGLSVSSDEEPDVDEEESLLVEEEPDVDALLERASSMDRSLSRKGVAKFFSAVGKGIVKVAKAVGGAIVAGFVAVGKAIVTVATAIGNVIKAFVDFVLSLFQCFGFGVVGSQGYTKTFLSSPAGYFKFSLSASVSDAIGGIMQGQASRSIGVGISLGFAIGATMEIGISVGVGISAGISCGVNSKTGGSCTFSIGVGITASAAIPDATCIFGPTIFGTFKCGKSFGLTLKILCCSINLITGCSSCGKGCSDSSTGSSNSAATAAVNKRGAGAISCSENLSGNGAGYRGCQDLSVSGRTCQKWSAQNPHKHTQCQQTTQTMKGKSMKVWCEGTTDTNKGLGDHNLCRNPSGHNTIWCYTTDTNKRWENCSPGGSSQYIEGSDRSTVMHASGGSQPGHTLTMHACTRTNNYPNCQFILEPSTTRSGMYYIKAKDRSSYVHSSGGTQHGHTLTMHACTKSRNYPNCQWKMEASTTRGGMYYIKGSDRNTFAHAHGGTQAGHKLTMHVCHKGNNYPNCQWKLNLPASAGGGWMNLMGKSASQVSTGWSGPASKAIDGNAANNYPSGSCTHTHKHQGAWWKVNLGSTQTVERVKVTNRGDCCGSRLNGFNVKVGSHTCASNVQISQGQTKEVACAGTGSEVTIQLRRNDYLTLCEVGVFTR